MFNEKKRKRDDKVEKSTQRKIQEKEKGKLNFVIIESKFVVPEADGEKSCSNSTQTNSINEQEFNFHFYKEQNKEFSSLSDKQILSSFSTPITNNSSDNTDKNIEDYLKSDNEKKEKKFGDNLFILKNCSSEQEKNYINKNKDIINEEIKNFILYLSIIRKIEKQKSIDKKELGKEELFNLILAEEMENYYDIILKEDSNNLKEEDLNLLINKYVYSCIFEEDERLIKNLSREEELIKLKQIQNEIKEKEKNFSYIANSLISNDKINEIEKGCESFLQIFNGIDKSNIIMKPELFRNLSDLENISEKTISEFLKFQTVNTFEGTQAKKFLKEKKLKNNENIK
ncbi:MAG TPA: hypothetical protein VLL98_05395 [Rickettsiales bacterium]|nr:hypothetical protein [Rickettsiales bacterium]